MTDPNTMDAAIELTPEAWRLLIIFAGTIVGLMIFPRAGGAVVVVGLTATVLAEVLPIEEALDGYSNPSVWLVLAAFLISRALIKTGLARRIALLFVRSFGGTSLGLSYSLIATDVVLATTIPSNAARCGGVILPITRSLAELYKSYPGSSAALLGSYLMIAIYQGDIIAAAMFLTGQASNVLAADFAADVAGVSMSWGRWLVVASVPAAVSLALIPLLLHRLHPPQITRTPEAADFARRELVAAGPLSRQEWIVLSVFVLVCLLWATGSWHGLKNNHRGAGRRLRVVANPRADVGRRGEREARLGCFYLVWRIGAAGKSRRRKGVDREACSRDRRSHAGLGMAGRAHCRRTDLLLQPLRIRQHHCAHPGNVSRLSGAAARHRRPSGAGGLLPGLLRQPRRRTHALRNHTRAHDLQT